MAARSPVRPTAAASMLELIINADDFGASPGINRAVAVAHRDGVLNSASLMVNAPYAAEAVRLAAGLPGLKVGVHLNLTAQAGHRCLADPREAPLLARPNGVLRRGFFGLLLLSLLRPAALRRQAEVEMRAQVEKARTDGVVIAHLDSHRHVHMIPALFGVARRLQAEYGVSRLRDVNESLAATRRAAGLGRAALTGGLLKYLILKVFSRLNRGGGDCYFYSILHTTRLFGRNLGRVLVPAGWRAAEICLHPSVAAADREEWREDFRDFLLHSPNRQREFEALMDKTLPTRVTRR